MKVFKYTIWSILSAVFLAILMVVAALVYDESYSTYVIKHVQKNAEVLLKPDKNEINIASYDIHITGYIKGKAKLEFYEYSKIDIPENTSQNRSVSDIVEAIIEHRENDKKTTPYMEMALSGQVNIKRVAEYYGVGFYVKYIPQNVKEGNLKIEYHF